MQTLAAIRTKLQTTGKLPPFTAKTKATLEAEARPLAEAALAAGGFTVGALEVTAYKGNGPRRLPWVSVSFVDFTGTEAQHLAAKHALKAHGISCNFATVERRDGFTSRTVNLFYPHG